MKLKATGTWFESFIIINISYLAFIHKMMKKLLLLVLLVALTLSIQVKREHEASG